MREGGGNPGVGSGARVEVQGVARVAFAGARVTFRGAPAELDLRRVGRLTHA